MSDGHDWQPHPEHRHHIWRKCTKCGCSRLTDSMPGWPSWYVYFGADGSYSADEGRKNPPCAPRGTP